MEILCGLIVQELQDRFSLNNRDTLPFTLTKTTGLFVRLILLLTCFEATEKDMVQLSQWINKVPV